MHASPLDSLSHFLRPRASASKPTVGLFTYQGCVGEPNSGRLLASVLSDPAMTLEKCADHAASYNVEYFGVEYSKECWIGSFLNNPSSLAESACASPCKGDTTETCGGSMKLNLYRRSTSVSTGGGGAPTTAPTSTPGGSSGQGFTSKGWWETPFLITRSLVCCPSLH